MMLGLAYCEVDGRRGFMLYDADQRKVAPTSLSGTVGDLVREVLGAGEALERARTGDWADASTVTFLPPADASAKVLCVAQNFSSHAQEVGGEDSPPAPVIFLKPPTAFVGHCAETRLPAASSFFDYEAELVAVIGRRVYDVGPVEAQAAIVGYTIANDGTARDLAPISIGGRQIVDWFSAKCIDSGSVLGPAIFPTPAGVGPDQMRIRCRLNDEVVQDDVAAAMTVSPGALISHVSRLMVLEAGDMVLTGTPAGVGKARGRALQDGDRLAISVDPFGELRTTVVASEGAPR